MKHLIETTDLSSLTFEEYDRIVLDSTTDKIIGKEGVTYELVSDEYIYNETDNKYYQKLVVYGNSNRIDLNSEWGSDTEDDEYNYFKSNSNVGVGNSYSQCKVTWSNLTSITFKYMSSSEMDYDYLCVGKLDGEKFTSQPSDGGSNVYLSTYGKTSGVYNEFTIKCDEGEHHIWFCYIKDSSGNDGKDRGFIGVPKSVVQILDVKQGSELPMEYKFGGVSVENGKTYDINFKNVILPNGNNAVTFYEDYTKTEKTINYEYVNLGLESGTLWAKCNIGAATESDYGVYFQWGDISGISRSLIGKYPNENYSWATAPFNNESSDYDEVYFNSVKDNVCPNGILAKGYDTATQIMGSDWRMPTKAEFDELLSGTTNEWTQVNGVNGRKFTGSNGNYIFIPAADGCFDGSFENPDGVCGGVWSSSLKTSNPGDAWCLSFSSDFYGMYGSIRSGGFVVRGVRK